MLGDCAPPSGSDGGMRPGGGPDLEGCGLLAPSRYSQPPRASITSFECVNDRRLPSSSILEPEACLRNLPLSACHVVGQPISPHRVSPVYPLGAPYGGGDGA